MTDEKRIHMCERYAQQAWTVALAIAKEAGRTGKYGGGYAVIAEEMRNLANKLFDCATKARFDGDASHECVIPHVARELGFLGFNAQLEILRVENNEKLVKYKAISVCAEDICSIAWSLNELAGNPFWRKPFILPELSSPLTSTQQRDYFFSFSIGGIPFVENALCCVEELICCIDDEHIKKTKDSISLRGLKIPIIDCYKRFNLPTTYIKDKQSYMIINPSYTDNTEYPRGPEDKRYAIAIDDLDIGALFASRIGANTPPTTNHPLTTHTRECWNATANEQLQFIDWDKLIK